MPGLKKGTIVVIGLGYS